MLKQKYRTFELLFRPDVVSNTARKTKKDTDSIFKAGRLFCWIRSYEKTSHNSWVTEELLTNLGKVGNQGSSTFQEREIYRTMLRKTTMKILQGTDEDPMSFQKLARRRTENIFKAGGLSTWIRSYKVLLMKHWGLCTPCFVKIPSVELLKISLKSEFKNRLHWSWNKVGLDFERQQGKKGKYFKVKTMWL